MFQILSDAEKSEIHNTAKRILSEIGIRVRNKKIYDLILETGGQADKKDKVRIYMPEKMVDKYFSLCSKQFVLKIVWVRKQSLKAGAHLCITRQMQCTICEAQVKRILMWE